MSGDGPRLVARRQRLGPAFDLLATYRPGPGFFIEREGLGVASVGVARGIGATGGPGRMSRLADAVRGTLGAVTCDGDGPAPVAVGAIPFDEQAPAMLVVPERATMRASVGETWQVDVVVEGLPHIDEPRERWAGRTLPFGPFEDVQPVPRPDAYAAGVERIRQEIAAGLARKVVLARTLLVRADRELDPKQLLWRLRAVDPDCYSFAAPTFTERGGELLRSGTLVGASPELLISRRGRRVRAEPLAGSAPRFGDPAQDRASAESLQTSVKDREEHAAVADYVAEALWPLCERLDFPSEPGLLGTANVWHLSTPFAGRLKSPEGSVLDLLSALHPTPAVCGTPTTTARLLIQELEPFHRGCYAGPVGWIDANGDGDWAIALRCAELAGGVARLYAGAGIVADSVPEAELDETERKFRAFLDSLRWG